MNACTAYLASSAKRRRLCRSRIPTRTPLTLSPVADAEEFNMFASRIDEVLQLPLPINNLIDSSLEESSEEEESQFGNILCFSFT